MSDPLEATLDYQRSRVGSLPGILHGVMDSLTVVEAKEASARKRIGNIALSREFYKKGIDSVYAQSVGELEKVVNLALAYVFFDRDYRLKITLEERYGKSLSLVLVDGGKNPPLEVDLKEGTGQGIRTVVSFVLHFYYLVNLGALPFIFADEAYSAISVQYRDRFFAFVKGICAKKDGGLVVITHDISIQAFADRTYIVSDGIVSEEKTR